MAVKYGKERLEGWRRECERTRVEGREMGEEESGGTMRTERRVANECCTRSSCQTVTGFEWHL